MLKIRHIAKPKNGRWHAIRFRKSCYALRALAPFSGWRPIGKSLDQILTSTDCVHLPFASPVRPPRRSRVTKFGPSKNITDIQNKFRISHIFFGTSSSDFPLAEIIPKIESFSMKKLLAILP